MLKACLIAMGSLYIVLFWISIPLFRFYFSIEGIYLAQLKAIYCGIIILSGFIMGCTWYMATLIEDLKSGKMESAGQSRSALTEHNAMRIPGKPQAP